MNGIESQSFIAREEQFEDRWTSFGKHSGILKIYKRLSAEKLKELELFRDYDLAFLEKISPDICIAVWDKNRILYEEGSYIDLAFFVLKGSINVYIQKQQHSRGQPIFDKYRTGIDGIPSGKNGAGNGFDTTVFQTKIKQIKQKGRVTFLSSMDIDLPWGEVLSLGPGDFFGETGASVGWPQSVTAKTSSQCVLVQVRIPALQAMKRKSKALKTRLNQIYIDRSLAAQLKNTPLFRKCSDQFIDEFKKGVELTSFKRGDDITLEGETPDALFLVRSGFIKLSQKFAGGEIVVNYLSKGMVLGEIEFLMKQAKWLYTATSVENTELVKISHQDFKGLIKKYPDIQKHIWESSAKRIKESGLSKRNISRSEFLNSALDNGLVEANSMLVIDLDVCTRCDDCVRGCADTHDGLPRFVREGEKYNNFLITRSCYQCEDPVCLIGCPTGAIRRAGVGDIVEIDDELCIGCKACYQKCPYDTITMVDSVEYWGHQHAEPRRVNPDITEVATKCDLCYDLNHTPACVDNCPQGCAIRVDSVENFTRLLLRSDRKINRLRSFRLRKIVRLTPWFHSFIITGAFSAFSYSMAPEVLPGNLWGLSYGAAATILMSGAALYGIRRRSAQLASKRNLGKARTWLQFHIYGGILFLLFVFMHTGFKLPTGTLYLWLWSLSIWITISGIVGIFLQKLIPQMLSSGLAIEVTYERIPELIDEIKKKANELAENCSQPVKDFYRKKILPSMRSPKIRYIYFFDITGGIQRRLKQFQFLKNVLTPAELEKLEALELLYKSKLEIDAHYTLQKALKSWLVSHVPVSIVLVVLVAIHLFAVFYY